MADQGERLPARGSMPEWGRRLSRFQDRSWSNGLVQLLDTLVPYILILAVMGFSIVRNWPYWSTLLLAVPAALFLIRGYIIFHDCTHGSFLPSNHANRIVGFLMGILVFTAFEPWRISHLRHHATNGQLDHRGTGEVITMTFEEYRDAPKLRQLRYRAYRNPIVLFLFGPFYTFVIAHRFDGMGGTSAERRSVIITNLAIAAIGAGVSLAFGFRTYVAVQLPVILLAGSLGIWLFYVQHQFDPGYWARDAKWSQFAAAMYGSSYYKLPSLLRWFTGNIGLHHLHHLRPRIPNYRLWKAYQACPQAHIANPLTLWRSLKSVRINLWSESLERFLSFGQAARIMRDRSAGRG